MTCYRDWNHAAIQRKLGPAERRNKLKLYVCVSADGGCIDDIRLVNSLEKAKHWFDHESEFVGEVPPFEETKELIENGENPFRETENRDAAIYEFPAVVQFYEGEKCPIEPKVIPDIDGTRIL